MCDHPRGDKGRSSARPQLRSAGTAICCHVGPLLPLASFTFPSDPITRQIREHATRWHEPARIVQVTEIPRTKRGKIVELALRDVVHGRVKNKEALATPEALEQFRDREELI
jgi:acyl-CoA synthetase (AMP-forming)/AMP-acid ligase II